MNNLRLSTIAAEELSDIIGNTPYNKWIFRQSSPKQKRNYTYCYGPQGYCPHQLEQINDDYMLKRVGIIPYFDWLGNSWLLLGIRNGTLTDFGSIGKSDDNKPITHAFSIYYDQTCGLMTDELMIGPKSLIGLPEQNEITIFLEYKEFPSDIIQKYNKLTCKDKTKIDQLAIVQYSYLLSDFDRFNLSPTLEAIMDRLPDTL